MDKTIRGLILPMRDIRMHLWKWILFPVATVLISLFRKVVSKVFYEIRLEEIQYE